MAENMVVLESVRVLNWPCTGREGDDTWPSLLDHSMVSFEFSDVVSCRYWPAHDAVKVCTDLCRQWACVFGSRCRHACTVKVTYPVFKPGPRTL